MNVGGHITFVIAIFLLFLTGMYMQFPAFHQFNLFPADGGGIQQSASGTQVAYCQDPSTQEQSVMKFQHKLDNVTKKGDGGKSSGGDPVTLQQTGGQCNQPPSDLRHVWGPQTDSYVLIKKDVPLEAEMFTSTSCHADYLITETLADGKSYKIYFPEVSGELQMDKFFESRTRNSSDNTNNYLYLIDYQLAFAIEVGQEAPVPGTQRDGKNNNFVIADIYRASTNISTTWPRPLPPEAFTCSSQAAQNQQNYTVQTDRPISPDNDELQLDYFLFKGAGQVTSGWGIECKPAIYLYPSQKSLVNVKVYPKGFLTYTDPIYDKDNGWTVEADPNGVLTTNYNLQPTTYPYLYYESKIKDEFINKPEEGWVIQSSEVDKGWFTPLENKFNNILPKLGLNNKETRDFIEYWKKALPYSPYYFIGIVDKQNIDLIEPLEITPEPKAINRVRIYFERLDKPKVVEEPVLVDLPISESADQLFKVVEWGGLVKTDKDHPFTCSQ
jgi:hypothetical protein